jgi:Domain of unknown function (DUF4440)
MKRALILLCLALIAGHARCLAQATPSPSAAPGANAGMITDLEESAWQAYKNKQPRTFSKLLYKTYYGVYATGIKTLDMEVADIEKTDLHNYSLANIKVEFPNANIAIITYKRTQEATFDGKDVSGIYYNESVWIKKGHKWLNAFHTAIKAK